MGRYRPSEGHSLSDDGRRRDLSEHGKKPTNRGALTSWRWQREGIVRTWKETDQSRGTHQLEMVEREGLVRTRKETDQARGTHELETADRETCEDMERNRPIEAHSLSGHSRERNWSGHGDKLTEGGSLTPWRR